MRLRQVLHLGFTYQGNPRWSLDAVDEDSLTLQLRTHPGVSSSHSHKPSNYVGEVLRVTYHISATGRVIATACEFGDFEAEYSAQQERSQLGFTAPTGISQSDQQIRL